jgi:hypothetical protein
MLCCPSTSGQIESEGSQLGVCAPHLNLHLKHTHLHGSMTTHAMLHGDCNAT